MSPAMGLLTSLQHWEILEAYIGKGTWDQHSPQFYKYHSGQWVLLGLRHGEHHVQG